MKYLPTITGGDGGDPITLVVTDTVVEQGDEQREMRCGHQTLQVEHPSAWRAREP